MCIVMTKHFQPNRFHEHFFLHSFFICSSVQSSVRLLQQRINMMDEEGIQNSNKTKKFKPNYIVWCIIQHIHSYLYTHSEHKNSARRYIENTQAPNGVNGIEKKCYVDLLLMCSDEFWMDRQTTKPKPIRELDSVVRFIVKMKIYWFIPFVL